VNEQAGAHREEMRQGRQERTGRTCDAWASCPLPGSVLWSGTNLDTPAHTHAWVHKPRRKGTQPRRRTRAPACTRDTEGMGVPNP